MIVNTPTTGTEKEFAFSPPQFQLEPPADNPFAAMLPSTITRNEGSFDITWAETPIQPGILQAEGMLDEIINRTRLDVERFPSSAQVRSNYGLALVNRGRLEEAANEFSTALELAASHFVSLSNLARVRTLQGRFDEAESLFEKLSRAYPREIAPLVNISYIALRRNSFDKAVTTLKRAIQVDEYAMLPRYLLAIALISLQRPKDAITHLRMAAKGEVRSPSVYQALGVAYLMAGDPKRAVRSFRTVLALAPDNKDAVIALSNVLLQFGHAAALVELLAAYSEKIPDDVTARELLGLAYWEQKQIPAARAQFLSALRNIQGGSEEELRAKSRVMNNVGVCFDHLGDLEQAAQWYSRANQVHDVFDIVANHNLARLRIRQGRFEQAWKILELCREREPQNHSTPELQAFILEKEQRYDEAFQLLTVEIATGNANPGAYSGMGWILADVKRDFHSAGEILSEGLRRHPRDPYLSNNLAYTLLMSGMPGEARRILESIPPETKPQPIDTQVLLTATWGLLHLWEGDLEKGREQYRVAERLARDSRQANLSSIVRQKMHLELARAFLRASNVDAARSEVLDGLSVRNGRDVYQEDLIALREKLQIYP